MIAAISLIRRREDVDLATFRRHWLDPHGVMTAELPGLRAYVQHHCVSSPANNALARSLGIDGIPELWFDDIAQRTRAYTSPRLAACNVDSENFIGAVSRLVTQPQATVAKLEAAPGARVMLLAIGPPDRDWPQVVAAALGNLDGVSGWQTHHLLEQAPAPNSRIKALEVDVAGIAEVACCDEPAAAQIADFFTSQGAHAGRTATFAIEDHRFL
ncbi:MAG: EthD family reductase [Hyphomicrobiaceae bacterium]